MVAKLASEKIKLEQIPVIKLPASKLEACLEALTSAPHQLRSEVVKNVLDTVYPGFNEKRAFRALVAPALTRLHFARSEPPSFRPAPNAKIWQALEKDLKQFYVAQVLFDFVKIKLLISENMIPPSHSLRDTARVYGPRLVDRVRGLDVMLKYYETYLHLDHIGLKVAQMEDIRQTKKSLFNGIERVLQPGRVTTIDEARNIMMNKLLSDKVLSSSFIADEALKGLIQAGKIVPFRGAYAAIDSLMIGGIAINAVVRS